MRCEIISTATSLVRSSSTHVEQALRRRLRQRAGRLVEDQHARVGRDRPGDLHLLLHLHAQPTHGHGRVDVDPEAVEHLRASRLHRAPVDAADALRGSRPRKMFSAT